MECYDCRKPIELWEADDWRTDCDFDSVSGEIKVTGQFFSKAEDEEVFYCRRCFIGKVDEKIRQIKELYMRKSSEDIG